MQRARPDAEIDRAQLVEATVELQQGTERHPGCLYVRPTAAGGTEEPATEGARRQLQHEVHEPQSAQPEGARRGGQDEPDSAVPRPLQEVQVQPGAHPIQAADRDASEADQALRAGAEHAENGSRVRLQLPGHSNWQ